MSGKELAIFQLRWWSCVSKQASHIELSQLVSCRSNHTLRSGRVPVYTHVELVQFPVQCTRTSIHPAHPAHGSSAAHYYYCIIAFPISSIKKRVWRREWLTASRVKVKSIKLSSGCMTWLTGISQLPQTKPTKVIFYAALQPNNKESFQIERKNNNLLFWLYFPSTTYHISISWAAELTYSVSEIQLGK